jgi:hypothetical protein
VVKRMSGSRQGLSTERGAPDGQRVSDGRPCKIPVVAGSTLPPATALRKTRTAQVAAQAANGGGPVEAAASSLVSASWLGGAVKAGFTIRARADSAVAAVSGQDSAIAPPDFLHGRQPAPCLRLLRAADSFYSPSTVRCTSPRCHKAVCAT